MNRPLRYFHSAVGRVALINIDERDERDARELLTVSPGRHIPARRASCAPWIPGPRERSQARCPSVDRIQPKRAIKTRAGGIQSGFRSRRGQKGAEEVDDREASAVTRARIRGFQAPLHGGASGRGYRLRGKQLLPRRVHK